MYRDLNGKVVLLTGVGQMGDPTMWGNGAATAKVLACECRANVFACDLYLDAAEHTKKRIEADGGVCDVMAADVTSATQVKAFVEACMKKYGRIDVLVNNVGRSVPGGPAEIDEATWDGQTNVNLKSVYLTCHEVLPIMEKQGSGSIINLSSVAGLRYVGKPQVAYAAAKAAIVQFTKTTAVIYAKKGVRLNTVVPGLMHTPLVGYLADKYANGDLEGLIARRNNQVPMGKMGDGFDIANAIAFLASEKSRYITGQKIVVDGGLISTTPS
ncbi:hypothetical protein AYO21_06498 [Fonsecaea monophora]|uniref:Uncharacterized protein n=1 Tax=Fonsecaea monophora TaxID=254056 RepID=A0A177F4V7_9EURO|nr:hypothetical protein AYO21_06498 [Fonsecaea monophora]OAG39294.1 hypothetical protein AYO21_06498 [Fonsecaea monophora]